MNSKLVLTHLKHKGTFQKTVRTIGRMCKYEKEVFFLFTIKFASQMFTVNSKNRNNKRRKNDTHSAKHNQLVNHFLQGLHLQNAKFK